MIVRHFTVNGRVQGVGFRAATADKARALGLQGWVRNLDDGRVELMAAGDTVSLDRLRAWLDNGPTMAHVADVDEYGTPTDPELPATFVIR